MNKELENMKKVLVNALNNLNITNNLKNIATIIKDQKKVVVDNSYADLLNEIQIKIKDLIKLIDKFKK